MFYFKSFLWDITMHFWLFPISMALQISIIRKGKGLDLDQFWSKPNESVWHRWKIAQQFRGKCFCFFFVKKNVVLIDEKHEGDDCQSWKFAKRTIIPCTWKDFKTIFLAVAPSNLQISPKYYSSLEPWEHLENIKRTSIEYLKKIQKDLWSSENIFEHLRTSEHILNTSQNLYRISVINWGHPEKKCPHRGWLSIKVTTQLKTSKNSWEHWQTSKIIWYHP